ncbi:MAG: pectinesterase family protein [Bacteroidota bacterium]|nr:pectinesterase family protein [Bacteroidota bacterium]
MNKYICLIGMLIALPTFHLFAQEKPNITVAQDGSGDYKTIQEAVNACRAFQTVDKIIFIKNGIYNEKILIDSFFTHLKLVGESVEQTIITFGDFAGKDNMGTFRSYTMKITGDDIVVENLTIENSAGEVGQAVALHVEGDRCIFRNCRILGNQDTVYAAGQKSRQYFADCYIEGTTDFIFGAATAIFDRCTIHSKRDSYITAASTPQGKRFGYVFRNCKLTANPVATKVYLGRPWRDYSKTVFLNCEMGAHILPEGWHNWSRAEAEKSSFYAEYQSSGSGFVSGKRVGWSHQLSKKKAKNYQPAKIFQEESTWNPDGINKDYTK